MSILITLKRTCIAISFIVSSQAYASSVQDVQIATQGTQIEAQGGKTEINQIRSTVSNKAEQASNSDHGRKLLILALLRFYTQPRIHN